MLLFEHLGSCEDGDFTRQLDPSLLTSSKIKGKMVSEKGKEYSCGCDDQADGSIF